MIRCVVFDFDGTLVQSNGIKKQGFYEVARLLDAEPMVDAVLRETVGDRVAICAELVRRVEQAGKLPTNRRSATWTDYLVQRYTAYCEASIAVCPEIDGATRALVNLRARGLSLFINSATPSAPLRRLLMLRRMDSLFNNIFGTPPGKADNLRRIFAEERIDPGATVFVGDNEADRFAAQEVGCHFVGIENEFSGFTARPVTLIKNLHGLPDVVASLG